MFSNLITIFLFMSLSSMGKSPSFHIIPFIIYMFSAMIIESFSRTLILGEIFSLSNMREGLCSIL